METQANAASDSTKEFWNKWYRMSSWERIILLKQDSAGAFYVLVNGIKHLISKMPR